jgi:AraC-like DNA-binding protein
MSGLISQIYLWDNRAMYLGALPDVGSHRLAAAALIIGLEDSFEITNSVTGVTASCRTALIPPGCEHESRYNGKRIAVVFLEAESNDYGVVKQLMDRTEHNCLLHIKNEEKVIETLNEICASKPDASRTLHLLNSLLYVEDPVLLEPKPIDKRIREVMGIIRADPALSHPLESLATRVHLSSTRFTHLFKEETGVPIRRYRQWQRFKLAIQLISEGKTMSHAASITGFTDSAHFSRAFRSMFGLKPSVLFRKSNTITTIIG